jgi:hypothetical protein
MGDLASENQICYCFGYSEEDRTTDVIENNGRSLIIGKILAAKKGGGCSCGDKHPLGR